MSLVRNSLVMFPSHSAWEQARWENLMDQQRDLLEETRETNPVNSNFNNSRRFPGFPIGLIESAAEYGYVTNFDDVDFQRKVQVDRVWIENHEALTSIKIREIISLTRELEEEVNTQRSVAEARRDIPMEIVLEDYREQVRFESDYLLRQIGVWRGKMMRKVEELYWKQHQYRFPYLIKEYRDYILYGKLPPSKEEKDEMARREAIALGDWGDDWIE